VAFTLPRPQLPVQLLQMLDESVDNFKRQAGPYLGLMESQGKIGEYRAEIDRLVRTAFETGLQNRQMLINTGPKLQSTPPPKDAA